MFKHVAVAAVLAGLLIAPSAARAHCDAVDGPVAKAARDRVSAELACIGHVEGIHLAAKQAGHAEGGAGPRGETQCE